jgi:hypothetical protein
MLIFVAAAITFTLIYIGIARPFLINLHRFLSINQPAHADVMIVEGWLFDYMMVAAAEEFKANHYRYILVSGFDTSSAALRYGTSAEKGATNLRAKGIDSASVFAAPFYGGPMHKTYNSAVATKKWLLQHDPKGTAINVFTGGPHGRKTFTIYKNVFGQSHTVGIISCDMKHYNPQRWWLSRSGIYATVKSVVGYLYALTWPFPQVKPD